MLKLAIINEHRKRILKKELIKVKIVTHNLNYLKVEDIIEKVNRLIDQVYIKTH